MLINSPKTIAIILV